MTAFRRGNRWASKFQLDGKQHWTPGGPWETKTQAQNAESHYRDRLRARRSEETCASFAERWVREWPRKAPATRAVYERAARVFAEHFGPTPLGEVERLEARTWALAVPQKTRQAISTMYEDARNVGLVEGNPFSNLRLPAREGDFVCPTLEEYRQLLASCLQLGGYAAEFRALIQFATWTCMRSGEVMAIRYADIDGDLINVRRARKTDGSYGLPKNGRERQIAFLEPAKVLDTVPHRPDDLVFHSPRGLPFNHATLYHQWDKVRSPINLQRAEVGKPGVRFHDLRHLGATQLLEHGLDHFAVSIQLGHTDNGIQVLNRYGHPSEEAALDRLVAAFGPVGRVTGSTTHSKVGAK